MKTELIEFCNYQTKKLTEKLNIIYTISEEGKSINIIKELKMLEFLESVYSVIERSDFQEGSVYDEYTKYLTSVREEIVKIKKEKERIEKENRVDIENIKLLLRDLNQNLTILERK
ncbi:hypothetical protein COC65_16760 [Bacillus thuringiensis]|uniref:hypothetical protein n=1 Tax=Bacillus thuringiensis TaxID=1428 RepID=UPI000BFE8F55|nr:hypothetical protein [Bacillus thuringiensis]PGS41320.1 hypothetical protein COC65_16760 [Bacillus thuringiensis]HDR7065672.1 hypothetical protein [Bacillus cereus]